MSRFPALLRQTTGHCNRAADRLGIAIAIVGVASIMLTILTGSVLLRRGVQELRTLIGDEPVVMILAEAGSIRSERDIQKLVDRALTAVDTRLKEMPEAERAEALGAFLRRLLLAVGPLLSGILLLHLLLWGWSRSFFLTIGVRAGARFTEASSYALKRMLPLIFLYLLSGIIALFWFPLAIAAGQFDASGSLPVLLVLSGFIFSVWIVPRIALAPVILMQGEAGPLQSLRASFEATRGHWPRVIGNLIGVQAVVWIAVMLMQAFLDALTRLALPFSPLALFIPQFLTFVILLGAAYRAVFLVKLKEALS